MTTGLSLWTTQCNSYLPPDCAPPPPWGWGTLCLLKLWSSLWSISNVMCTNVKYYKYSILWFLIITFYCTVYSLATLCHSVHSPCHQSVVMVTQCVTVSLFSSDGYSVWSYWKCLFFTFFETNMSICKTSPLHWIAPLSPPNSSPTEL